MGMVITFLTMSLALAKSKVATDMRRLLPYISRISGVLLVIAGIYLIDYGIWDYQIVVGNDFDAGNLLVDQFLEFQDATTQLDPGHDDRTHRADLALRHHRRTRRRLARRASEMPSPAPP